MKQPNHRAGDHSQGAGASAQAMDAGAVEAQVANLRGYFAKHPGMRCLLIVDPSKRDLKEDGGTQGSLAELERAFIEVDHDGFPEAHRPYLIELDLAGRDGIERLTTSVQLAFEDRHPESMAGGLGQRIGGWLATSASASDVAEHWSRQILQYDEHRSAFVVRFYDSRALSLIWPILSERQQQALLGPVNAWLALDACAQPCIYTRVARSQAALSLTFEQWQSIHRHGVINRALALHAIDVARQPLPPEIEVAAAAAARAEQYGLFDDDDQVAFVGHALTWHPQFDLHPKVLEILGARAPKDFYTAAIEKLTSADVEAIRNGAWYDRLNTSATR